MSVTVMVDPAHRDSHSSARIENPRLRGEVKAARGRDASSRKRCANARIASQHDGEGAAFPGWETAPAGAAIVDRPSV